MAARSNRLEIEEDPAFQRADWRVQRAGWALLALTVMAGLAGLLGSGPLSDTTRRAEPGLEVRYERFLRHGKPTDLRVRVDTPHARGQVSITIGDAYFDASSLDRIVPAPMLEHGSAGSVTFVFRAPAAGPLNARFRFEPSNLGLHAVRIRTDRGATLALRQFTYP